jgi:phage-related protein
MEAVIVSIVTMLANILPEIGTISSPALDSVISTLAAIIPAIGSFAGAVIPIIKNIIAGLQGAANVTPAQLATLQALDAQCDAAFESAAAADGVAPQA